MHPMGDLRSLPKVDVLALSPRLAGYSHAVRTEAARVAIATLRDQAKQSNGYDPSQAEILAAAEAARLATPSLRRVLNATGVLLHTGLGRARLSEQVSKRLYDAGAHHSATEIDLETGGRGDRQTHVRDLLRKLTAADDAYVVNNGAAAILLTLAALCRSREVVLSRGEMVEIGGSFRMPDVISESGCRLVEVGCTNKTRISDYESAIGEGTAAILRCHPSNYRIFGFSQKPSDRELAALATSEKVLFLYDLGSGCLWDTSQFGLPRETTVQDALASGADVVTASGDKLLGGPQAGLILGSKEAIATIAAHPLARALRVDKLTLAALEATLRLHAENRLEEIPTYRYLSRSLADLKKDARRLARAFPGRAAVEMGESEVGGGAAPGVGIPTWRARLETSEPDRLAQRLRQGEPPLLSRIENGAVYLDPRTLEPAEVREAIMRLEALEAS